jgi:RecB family endonuclease NucS
MAVQMAIWKMTSDGPLPLTFSQLGQEQRLEDMIVRDPSLTGMDLLVIGRQVATAYGGFIDVLAVDSNAIERRVTWWLRFSTMARGSRR